MYNKSQLSRDKKNAKKQVSMPNPFGKDVDYVSQMGYRDDSPFKDRPYIDINTPNGTIDMSNTGVDLIANGRFLPKYSGTHQFDTNVVREERIAEEGGEYLELDKDQIAAYRAGGYVVEELPEEDNGGVYSQDIPYPPKHNPANSFAVNDPRSMQPGGGVKYTVDPNDPNIHIYSDKYAYNLAKKEENNAWAAYNYYRNNMTPPAFTYDERNWAGMRTGNKVKPKPSDKDVKHVPASVGHSMVRNQYTWQGIQNNNDPYDDLDYKCYEGDPRCNEKGLLPEFRGIKPSGYDIIDWTYPTGNKSRAVVSVFDKPTIKNIYREPAEPTPPSKGQKSPQTTAKVKTSNESKPSTEFEERWENNTPQMVKVDYPTDYSEKSQHLDENGNIVTETIYYDVPKNANESFSITPPPINDDLEFEPPVEAQSTNPDPLNAVEQKSLPKTYVPEFTTTKRFDSRTGKWVEEPFVEKGSTEDTYNKARWEWAKSNRQKINPEQKVKELKQLDLKGRTFAEGGSIMDLDLTEKEIEQYRRGGYIVEELPTAQDGLETGVVESKTPWAGAANFTGEETTPPVIFEGKDVTVKAQGPKWAKFQKEYESSKPWEKFLYGEQEKYLRKNKGLNKAAGVSMDNFPQAERIRIKQEYDQKMNDYITRRLGKSEGFNPRRRGEWVDQLTDREKQIVAGSRYGSKLQPDAWSRFMSGARSIYNAGPLSNVTGDITTQIPGYTKKENKAALNNWAEGMEAVAPLDIPGMVVANKMKNMNVENPSWYSGEMMANVDYGDVAAMNPLTLLDLYGLPAGAMQLGRGVAKGSKALGQTLETQKALLSNAYDKVATGNSPLTDFGFPAWKVERPTGAIRSSDYIVKPYTDYETELLTKYGFGMRDLTPEDWEHFSKLTKSGVTDFSKGDYPISRVIGYYAPASSENKVIQGLKRGDVFTTPAEKSVRTWSAGVPDISKRDWMQGQTRLIIPSRYTKDLGSHFAGMPYYDKRVDFVWNHPVHKQPNMRSVLEKELMGNIPEGFKVIGTSSEDGMRNLIIKPLKNSGSSSQFTRSGLGGMDMSNHVIKNVDYYTQLLNTYNSKALPAANRKFYKDLIANVKKQDGLVTERQLNELKRLATGNFDFGSKGYNKGYEEGGTSEPPVKTLPEVTVRPKTLGSIVDNRPEYTKGYYDPWGVSDNTLENVLEIFDPTGMTSWDDIVRAEREFGKDSWQANLERLGAMPFLGKAAKTLKGVRGVPMTARQARNYNTTVKGLQGTSRLGRGSDAYQAADEFGTGGSYVDNQLTHFQKAGTVPLWYKENQINPSAFVSGYRGGEEPNTYKYGFLDNAGPGQLIGGAGLGIPKYGVDANVTGIVPTSPEEMQYFKGVYGANLSKQFKDVNLGLGVNTAITGYPGEKGFVRDPMSFEPSVSLKYNFKKDGGLNKRIVKRYPGMQSVYGAQGENLNIIKDPSFSPSDSGVPYGDIEFIHPGTGKVTYFAEDPANDIVYQSPTPDKYTAVYNPRGANKHDVFLDMMHGMRNDPEYVKLLDDFASEAKKSRSNSMDHWYNYDVENYNYIDGREAWDNNYIDGLVRSHLAKKGMGRHSFGAKDYKMERQGSTPEMYNAADNIYKYLKGKQNGGNTDPGNNALELHMFYDKDVYKKQKGGNTFQPGQIYTYDENPGVFYKLDNSGNIVVKNKEAGSNEYVAIKDPKGTRRKTLEYGLNTGSTNLYGTPEQYAEYSNKGSAINDFFFSENEAAKQLHQSNAEQCLKDSPNCLSSTWLYYDRHIAPNLGLPSSWQLKENAGIYSGPKETNSAFPKYGESADSWDIARAIIEGQGKSYYAAKDDAGVAYPTKKFWKDLNLPIGAIINAGSKGGGLKYGKGDTYNEGAGLVPSNHSAMVGGFDEEGVPYIYDYGKILKATDPNAFVNAMGITNITAPKELIGQTYANLKKQNKLKDEITDLRFNISDVALNQISDIDEYKPFLKNLESNKSEIMSALGISNKTYDEYAKRAAAIALTETGGGNDASIRWKGIIPVPSYITDKIGFGSSQGITQINTDVLFSSDKTKKQMNALGITKDNYDPYNSKHIAAATMIMLADADKVAMANLKKHSSNKQDLNPAAATYYQWNSPSTLVKGEAQGDNLNVKRFMQNYNMINTTFKKDGGAVEYLTQEQIDRLRAQGYHVVEE